MLEVRGHVWLDLALLGAAIWWNPPGRYFARFVVETTRAPLPAAGQVVGIDLGLEHFAVLSDGRKIASPDFFRRGTLARSTPALVPDE